MENPACPLCGLQLNGAGGIVRALPPERAASYARFIAEYERIRAAEGRSSATDAYYCDLPYRDITDRHSRQWRIRARSYDCLLRRVLQPQIPGGGRILDLGAGNCWMSHRLALAGYSPVAVDLLTNAEDGLGAATHYRNSLPALFPRFQAELARLPFADAQFDAVIFNASFHYAEDAEATLSEALRCARPRGLVIISDTPWYRREESGRQMVAERQAIFCQSYGTASDALHSMEYLTDLRLRTLAERSGIDWAFRVPRYGLRWRLRPLVARLRARREPSHFRIWVARKPA
ncbi:MAG TPA: class I SAM-dependent methyltransferase [Acidobacteriaceae bacterium]|nr:class I SAM-dependent methyltransferase [Acidobacteriaceae bacterium]